MIFEKGVTLLELLIALTIMSLTLTIGLPHFQALIVSSRLTASANAMMSALQLARFEALKQQKNVVVANKNGKWENGWLVFVDEKIENNQLDSNEYVLTHFDALHSSVYVTAPSAYKNYVYYDKYGRINADGLGNGTLSFCTASEWHDFRAVVIALTGRIHIESSTTKPSAKYETNCQ